MLFYRFRSASRLLEGNKELERQTIYFAPPEQLNDPMEGYRDVYWKGDEIVWRNLLDNYLRCLDRACSVLAIAGETHHKLSTADLPVAIARDDFPTEEYRQLFNAIRGRFFGSAAVSKYVASIATTARSAGRDEVEFHLQNLHFLALQCISSEYAVRGLKEPDKGLWPDSEKKLEELNDKFFSSLAQMESKEKAPPEALDDLFRAAADMTAQLHLLRLHNKTVDLGAPNKKFVILDFPKAYLKALESLLFPSWYTACFMTESHNSAVWGHYGNSHSGICLIFDSETRGGREILPLEGINGWGGGGPVRGTLSLEFLPIFYAAGLGEIDFFRSMGRLSSPVLRSTWYSDTTGKVSPCSDDLVKDEALWRSNYWKGFIRDITRKTPDWAYEKEYRLILYGSVIDYSKAEHRVLTYHFASLKGLIFGINTSVTDKLEVMKIISRKCADSGRSDFELYQAYYSPRDKCIKHRRLGLLKMGV